MIYGLYSIRDAKTSFMPLTVDVNDASACRNFEHAVRQPESLLCSHSADYALYRVGSFDTDSGVVTSFPVPKQLLDASSCFKEV